MVTAGGAGRDAARRESLFAQLGPSPAGSNLVTFLAHSAPALAVRTTFACPVPVYSLEDLWASFEEASAYGVGVPIQFSPRPKDINEAHQCYVPYLSALQLFERDSRWLQPRCFDEGSDEDLYQESLYSDSHSISSIGSSSAGSEEDKSSPTPPTPRSICDRHQLEPSSKRLLFQFDETAVPHMREPLTDRVRRLAREAGHPELLSLRSDELHPHSWFAVAWYPLCQIPAGRCLKELSACFLTFHSMTPPLPGWHMPKRMPPPSRGGLPPLQLSKAVSRARADALPPVPAPAVAAALAPALQQRHVSSVMLSAEESDCCHRLFLLPFACVPYKAPAKAWLGSEAASCIHCNMIAAALSWNRYVGCKHSDLEFFAGRLQPGAGC